jgi:hypothetical protein
MSVTSAAPRRRDLLESILVGIYFVLTVYLSLCNTPSSIGLIFHEAIRPFQIKARARHTAAERSAAVSRRSASETRIRRASGANPNRPA